MSEDTTNREEASALALKTWTDLTECIAECGETEEEFRAAGIEGREMEVGIWAGWDGGDLWVSVLFTGTDGELWEASVGMFGQEAPVEVRRIGVDR